MPEQFAGWIGMAVAATVVVELFMAIPLVGTARAMTSTLHKSVTVLRATAISDHWKQRALRIYAASSMVSSVVLFAMLAGLLAAYVLVFFLTGSLLQSGFDVSAAIMDVRYLVGTFVVSVLYWAVRQGERVV